MISYSVHVLYLCLICVSRLICISSFMVLSILCLFLSLAASGQGRGGGTGASEMAANGSVDRDGRQRLAGARQLGRSGQRGTVDRRLERSVCVALIGIGIGTRSVSVIDVVYVVVGIYTISPARACARDCRCQARIRGATAEQCCHGEPCRRPRRCNRGRCRGWTRRPRAQTGRTHESVISV